MIHFLRFAFVTFSWIYSRISSLSANRLFAFFCRVHWTVLTEHYSLNCIQSVSWSLGWVCLTVGLLQSNWEVLAENWLQKLWVSTLQDNRDNDGGWFEFLHSAHNGVGCNSRDDEQSEDLETLRDTERVRKSNCLSTGHLNQRCLSLLSDRWSNLLGNLSRDSRSIN